MPVIIKGKMISHKNPTVCIPVTETGRQEILDKIGELVADGIEMIEWRIDHYEDNADIEKVKDLLGSIRPIVKDTIFLATYRTKSQGGQVEFPGEPEMCDYYEAIARAHTADIIDVEFFGFTRPTDIIAKIQSLGACVLTSHHDFNKTPRVPVMQTTLERMLEADADIVKLAVMPTKPSDVLDLLKVTDSFLSEHPGFPIITISMGGLGVLSRISGELFGSCVTFGAVGAVSAPGQMQVDELKQAISFIHKYSGDWQ